MHGFFVRWDDAGSGLSRYLWGEALPENRYGDGASLSVSPRSWPWQKSEIVIMLGHAMDEMDLSLRLLCTRTSRLRLCSDLPPSGGCFFFFGQSTVKESGYEMYVYPRRLELPQFGS